MAPNVALCRLGAAIAIVALGVAGLGTPIGASAAPNPSPAVGTPLPPGWEACVLQGVGAPVTQDNVADLDEWQVAEGGSTNNAAAYNPFNTRQVTDATGAALPADVAPGGFPAFASWAAGCSATVATLLAPYMAPIVAALMTGNVAPPGIFLSDVDETPWCAPSVAGIPCYANEVLAGELVGSLLHARAGQLGDALTGYTDISPDLSDYQEAALASADDQSVLSAATEELAVAEQGVSAAKSKLAVTVHALRRLAIDDYTTDRMLTSSAKLQLVNTPTEHDVLSEYFRSIAVTLLIQDHDRAQSAFKASVSKRTAASASVAQAQSVVDAAGAAVNQILSQLEGDVTSIVTATGCTTPPAITPTASPVAGQGTPGELWSALQDCLVTTPPSSAPTT